MARAMTAASRAGAGTTNEHHWTERAAALLAPLLYAAQLTDRPIEDVLRWVLREDLAPALRTLRRQPSLDRRRRAPWSTSVAVRSVFISCSISAAVASTSVCRREEAIT